MLKISELTFEHLLWQFTPVCAPRLYTWFLLCGANIIVVVVIIVSTISMWIEREEKLSKHSYITSMRAASLCSEKSGSSIGDAHIAEDGHCAMHNCPTYMRHPSSELSISFMFCSSVTTASSGDVSLYMFGCVCVCPSCWGFIHLTLDRLI